MDHPNDVRNPSFVPDRGLSDNEMTLMAGVLGTLSAVTILGNLLVILSFITDRKLWLFQNWFILSLGIADGLVGTIVMPLTLVYDLTGQWKFGPALCKAWQFLDAVCCSSSILNLCAINVARYWSVSKPLEYAMHMQTSTRAGFMIFFVWVTALATNLPLVVGWAWDDSPPPGPLQCHIVNHVGFVVYSASVTFFIPVTLMVFVAVAIHNAMRQRQKRVHIAESAALRVVQATARLNRASRNRTVAGNSSTSSSSRTKPKSVIVKGTKKAVRVDPSPGSNSEHQSTTLSPSILEEDFNPEYLQMKVIQQAVSVLPPPRQKVNYGACSNDARSTGTVATILSEGEGTSTNLAGYDTGAAEGPSSSSKTVSKRLQKEASVANISIHSISTTSTTTTTTIARESNTRQLGNRLMRTVAVVVIFFVVCWTPFYVVYLVNPLCSSCEVNPNLITFCIWLGYFNSTLNPVLYATMNRHFRKDFKQILTCKFLLKKR